MWRLENFSNSGLGKFFSALDFNGIHLFHMWIGYIAVTVLGFSARSGCNLENWSEAMDAGLWWCA